MSKKILIVFLFILIYIMSFCQNNNDLKINTGYGFWEGIHLGLSYNFKNYLLGIDYGMIKNVYPYSDGKGFSFVLNNSYFYDKLNKYNLKEEYFYLNILYNNYENWKYIRELIQINPGLGREFYLKENLAINIQGGITIPVWGEKIEKTNITELVFWIYPIMPELMLQLIYRI
jgi:hypothetical protein